MLPPLFFGLRQYVEASACLPIYIGKKSSEYGIKKPITESKKLSKVVVHSSLNPVLAAMEQKSRCTKRKSQLELINADSQLQWLKEQHPESAFTIQSLQDKLGRVLHLAEGLDIDEFCSNPFLES